MKLLELAEKIVDPWDLSFAGVAYVVGFAVALGASPGGVVPGELAALSATAGLTLKQILWRLTARHRVRRRGLQFQKLLAARNERGDLQLRLERELDVLAAHLIDPGQAARSLDGLVVDYLTPRPADPAPVPPVPALPGAGVDRSVLGAASDAGRDASAGEAAQSAMRVERGETGGQLELAQLPIER